MIDSVKLIRGQAGPNPHGQAGPNPHHAIFGKSFNVRPGARVMEVSNPNLEKVSIKMPAPRDKNDWFDSIRRPGAMVQDQIKKDYDFEKVRANDIFKFGSKVNLGKQLDFTFKNENGEDVTKSLSELSFDMNKKLEELKAISATGNNQGLEQKMELLNTLVGEISGKFAQLSADDMKNISKILTNLGEKIKAPVDVGVNTRYLTQEGYKANKNTESFIIWISSYFNLMKRVATSVNKAPIMSPDELTDYFEDQKSDKRILDLNNMTFYSFANWNDLQSILSKPGREGLIDGLEFDDHPKTIHKVQKKDALIANIKKDITSLESKISAEARDYENAMKYVNDTIAEINASEVRLANLYSDRATKTGPAKAAVTNAVKVERTVLDKWKKDKNRAEAAGKDIMDKIADMEKELDDLKTNLKQSGGRRRA